MLKNIWNYYQTLPEVIRNIVKRMFGSFLILSIICSVATYWYALKYGARIPLDGVPFLAVISIVASVILTFVSFITLLLSPDADINPLFRIEPALSEIEKEQISMDREIEKMFDRRRNLVIFTTGITILSALFYLIILFGGDITKWNSSFIIIVFSTAIFLTLFRMAYVGKLTKKGMKIINNVIYWGAIGGIFILLSGTYFSHILQTTRYGGGISVVVQSTDKGVYIGNLFLVTRSNVVVWSPEKSQFFDLNKNHIVSISTVQEGTIEMPPKRNLYNIFIQAEKACYKPPNANQDEACENRTENVAHKLDTMN